MARSRSAQRLLLDTCVLAELQKPAGNPAVIRALEAMDDDALYLSVLTIAEIRKGIDKLAPGKRQSHLEEWLTGLVTRYDDHILPVDLEVAEAWGRMNARVEALGDGEDIAAARVVIDKALAGNAVAARFCVDRLMPRPRGRTIALDLPDGAGASDIAAAYDVVVQAMATGEITPDEALQVSRVLDGRLRALKMAREEKRNERATPKTEPSPACGRGPFQEPSPACGKGALQEPSPACGRG